MKAQRTTIGAALALAALGGGTTAALSATSHPGRTAHIAGTWLATVTLTSPPPGVPGTFKALDTIAPGGALVVSSSQVHPAERSLAHGACARVAARRFACSFSWFRFDASGTPVGMQRVRRTMTVSPDGATYTAQDRVEVLAPDGSVVASFAATEGARRLPA